MEGVPIERAKALFGDNFIGKDELLPFVNKIGNNIIGIIVPDISFSEETLIKCSNNYILILGLSVIGGSVISIATLRELFGVDPEMYEPCFYNQDWYLKQDFIHMTLENKWYLIKKDVIKSSRAVLPSELVKSNINFPSAILCAYTFFAYFFAKNKKLWYHDFVWCSDKDHNGDRIYVGKYNDIDGVNKNGFSIHRHLALRECYGAVDVF